MDKEQLLFQWNMHGFEFISIYFFVHPLQFTTYLSGIYIHKAMN